MYKRQGQAGFSADHGDFVFGARKGEFQRDEALPGGRFQRCLLYTSDAADERSSVDLGGRRIIKKKNKDTDMGYVSS